MEDVRLFLTPGERGIVLEGADPVATLVELGAIARVDWSGEDHEGQIVRFVLRRLAAFGVGVDAQTAVVESVRDIDVAGTARGERVPAILHAVDRALSTTDVALGELRSGDDSHRIGVIPRTTAALRIHGRDRPSCELLYVLDCPCGAMNVWQLPESVPRPAEGACDSCGRGLFDPSGEPIAAMTVEPA